MEPGAAAHNRCTASYQRAPQRLSRKQARLVQAGNTGLGLLIWLIAALVALLLGSTYLLDGPSATDAECDTAADVQTAQIDAQQANRSVAHP